MIFKRLEIPEIVICKPEIVNDKRGYIAETFRLDKLQKYIGYNLNFCQDNESKSTYGVLRGLHYQVSSNAQTKLVRVLKGSVLDVVVDLRQGSPTFGQHISVILSQENGNQLLIPRGFAHGFLVLSDEAIFTYKVDNYYCKSSERGIAFDDEFLKIDWKLDLSEIKISKKDALNVNFENADFFNYSVNYYD